MPLAAYQTQTRSLLQLPGTASTSLYTDSDLTRWINIARGQVAGEGKCIAVVGTVATVVNQRPYQFQAISTGNASVNGIQGIINIESISYQVGSGELWLTPRPWPWFTLYELNNAAPSFGPPRTWSQFGQGAAPPSASVSSGSGSFYVSPLPDTVYQLNCYSTGYPVPLVDDNTVEALPYLWTDCVPFFAAYFALMSAQTNARMADAAQMYKNHYKEFMDRARIAANPDANRWMYKQAGDPAQGPKMSIKGGAQ